MGDDDTALFVFPELPDPSVVALNQFLEDLYTAFQNHYFIQLDRRHHEPARQRPDDNQMPLPLDPSF